MEDLAPALSKTSAHIPFMMDSDVVAKGLFVQNVYTPLTSKFFVEYEVGRPS